MVKPLVLTERKEQRRGREWCWSEGQRGEDLQGGVEALLKQLQLGICRAQSYQSHWGLSSPSGDKKGLVVLLGLTTNTFQVLRVAPDLRAGEDSSWARRAAGF